MATLALLPTPTVDSDIDRIANCRCGIACRTRVSATMIGARIPYGQQARFVRNAIGLYFHAAIIIESFETPFYSNRPVAFRYLTQ